MHTLTILNAGCETGALTLRAAEELRSAETRVLHTGRCPLADWLDGNGLSYETLDGLYETAEDFDEHIALVEVTIREKLENGDVLYCVMGFDDETAKHLAGVVPGVRAVGSGAPEDVLRLYAEGPCLLLSATQLVAGEVSSHENVLITEIDNRNLAGDVKLKLMEAFPDEWSVYLKKPGGAVARLPLENLDRMAEYDHRACALIPRIEKLTDAERFDMRHLMEIAAALRDPVSGCPWDRQQTHATLRNSMIEETYEVADAVDADDPDSLYDELGDVLLHVALHAQIAREEGEFEPADITTAICRKMIRRHPHVFSGEKFSSVEEINAAWERIKREEKKDESLAGALRGTSKALPALMRAQKILYRADKAGFVPEKTAPESAEALGEILFDAVKRAFSSGVNAEEALSKAIDGFIASLDEKK